jgi:hypothetical protein
VTPNGSKDRIRIVVGTAKAVLAAGDYLAWHTDIEGIRIADFRWGSAQAKQVILRFGVKAPAGTYAVRMTNGGFTRTHIATFTVSAGQANTDTEQVLMIPGDVTGTWATDATVGIKMDVSFALGSSYQGVVGWQTGSFLGTSAVSNGMATAGNIFELFDVGLYLDPNATGVPPPWQMPDEAQELLACQRYYQKLTQIIIAGAYGAAGGSTYASWTFLATTRAVPTVAALGFTYANSSGFVSNTYNTDGYTGKIVVTGNGAYYATGYLTINARM